MADLDALLTGEDGGMDMGMGDEGAVTAQNPCYAQLLDAWRSEAACPELLRWRGDLVDGLVPFLRGVPRIPPPPPTDPPSPRL